MEAVLAMLGNAADGAFVIDENQRIVFWNGVAERMLGYAAEETLGHSCFEFIRGRDERDLAWCRNNCRVTTAARSGGVIETFNTLARTKTGETRWINVSTLVLPTAHEGESSLVIHLFRDATEIKQQEHFARQVLSLTESLAQKASTSPAPTGGELLLSKLTSREVEVLKLLAQGLSTDDIGATLSVSHATTRNHIQSILQKLHLHSRAEAVAYAFEHGLMFID